MKKAYKVTWISLASVLGVVIIVALIALFLVLSPKRLTSLVNRHASKFITCDYNIERVDLTLFKTFPNVGLEINDLVLINPTNGWTTDTLASIDECLVSVNLRKILFEDEIIVNSCQLNGGLINVFMDTEGNNNFDIFAPGEPDPDEPEKEDSPLFVNLNMLTLNDIEIRYTDLAGNTFATIDGLGLKAKGNVNNDIIDGDLSLNINDLTAKIDNDSSFMDASINNFAINGKINMVGDDINTNTTITTGALAFFLRDSDSIGATVNSLNMNYTGDINNYDHVKGNFNINSSGTLVNMGPDEFLDNAEICINIPVELYLDSIYAEFEKSQLKINDFNVEFVGKATMKDIINLNMDVKTNSFIINNLLNLLPKSLKKDLLKDIKLDGKLMLESHVEGTYSEEMMPVVNADVILVDGCFEMSDELPYPLTGVNTTLHADLDLNGKSDLYIKSLRAKMNNTLVAANGNIKDLLDKMFCDLSVKADVDFNDIKTYMPEEMMAQGAVKADINIKGSVEQLTELDLMNTKLNGDLRFKNLDFTYYDTINVNSSDLGLDFIIPNPSVNSLQDGLAHIQLYGSDLKAVITNMMDARLSDFNIEAQVSDVLDENATMGAIADFGIGYLDFMMDDMLLYSKNASGSAMMLPSVNEGNISYAAVYSSDSLVFGMADEMFFATEALSLDINADYDENETELLFQWKPELGLYLGNAVLSMADMSEEVIVPEINLTYGEPGLEITNSQITLGNSDFELRGHLTNLYEHFKNDELLIGEFDFTSDYTDVNQLMDIFNGAGGEEEVSDNAVVSDTTVVESDPFMVPLGVDIKMHTTIKNALAGEMRIRNVGGDLTIKDGILVLEEMGFTSDAAKMQLTALYKSKRRNHLYAGIDFHLMDINIAEMIKIIPDLDTIVPMLKSFAGNAEFHFAAETNLKSDYSLKYSTLKAACSIEGNDLVVLDSETFDKIKRMLFFSKKTDNKIDSLDVQFTVFKNEIDVYPFAVTMDKYSAMLYGRHNLDMSYDYNIAVLSPPVLNRLGLEIKGPDFDNMKFKIRRSRHRNLFKPEKRNYKEEKIAELKKIISNSLKDNVKP